MLPEQTPAFPTHRSSDLFGVFGADGALVQGCGDDACPDEDIIELANVCICCTVADDFLPTMQKLLDRPTPPDHIIIETSGLALPKPLVKAFQWRSEEHTSELQSLMRISYAVFCLKKKKHIHQSPEVKPTHNTSHTSTQTNQYNQ